jgi:iduronate 2-sulfatase
MSTSLSVNVTRFIILCVAGEHDTWAKMTNFEVALRTPLIIRAPWMKSSVGRVTSVLAEAVDFYPTLAALAGLPDPITEGQVGGVHRDVHA